MEKIACIVLPTYNEAENVGILLPLIFEQAEKIESHAVHVLVVDDNSPDGTQDVVKGLMGRFPNLHLLTGQKAGLGEAYKKGMAEAFRNLDPDLIFEMDADLQHPPALLPLFVTLASHGYSLVIGSRFAPGGSTPEFSLRRRWLSLFGNWLIRFVGGLPKIHDCTSGYRCIKTEVLKRCDLSALATRGYSFQSSLLCEMLRNGARVIEVPMTFGARVGGTSKLTFKDQLEFLVNIFRLRLRQSQELVRFCCVGLLGVFVNTGMLLFLTVASGLDPAAASPIAIETAILNNFVWNDRWTFRGRNSSDGLPRRLLRFHVVASAAGIVNYLTLLLLYQVFGVPTVAANLVGIALGTVVNYAMNSVWTWSRVPRGAAGS